ncbi:adipocyte plasma membrane-associated protein [Lingula anatina]|uniref:Adipocyte plasma membrane-associated protein n=1 Tax=Lingula anatina TaxID=7574 RepID=A0A1S3IP68_LINAN|nr:adipocyte plasma membrane-associated protein [Lingula anatina]|eukprot:XP_013399873.1 adipocyte plasma membrane-associated protein [Lingula anatina]
MESKKHYVIAVTVAVLACVALYLYPSPIQPEPFTYPPAPRLEGALAVNYKLQKAERWFEGRLAGPESFTVDKNGYIYTGLNDGRLVRFHGNHLEELGRTGQNLTECGTLAYEPMCGRPKGMKIGPDGHLYFVDAYQGLMRLNLPSQEMETLVPSENGSEGLPFRFLNGLDVSKDGVVYFTDSTPKWQRNQYKYAVLETNAMGRLLAYNVKTRKVRTLLTGLYLANGVAVSSDQSYVLVVEMTAARITKLHLKGSKAGVREILAENLPGYPDNINPTPQGTFYVGLTALRFEGMSRFGPFVDLTAPFPGLKRFIAKVAARQVYYFRESKKHYVIAVTVAVLACVALYLYPSPIQPEPFTYPPAPRLEGALAVNYKLQKAERWFEGRLAGPESFTVDKNGYIYTGLNDGRLVRFRGNHLEELGRTGQNLTECGTLAYEPMCGRPKGMKIGPDGHLYFVDAYQGLMRLNLPSQEMETLVPSENGSEGLPFRFLNGLDVSKDGVVYFTDSTPKWQRNQYKYAVLETNAMGRLLAYNVKTRKVRTLLTGLYLANGVAVSTDQSYVLVVEMTAARITKLHLRGSKAGVREILAENLPGYPDNINPTPQGTFYVGLTALRFEGMSRFGPFVDLTAPFPGLKRFIAKVTPLRLYDYFISKRAMFIEIDQNGEIVQSFHDPDGSVIGYVAEAFPHDGKIFLGHFSQPYIGVLSMDKL